VALRRAAFVAYCSDATQPLRKPERSTLANAGKLAFGLPRTNDQTGGLSSRLLNLFATGK
jgi:hypothetical protein